MTGAGRNRNKRILTRSVLAVMAAVLWVLLAAAVGAGSPSNADRAFLAWDIQIELQQQDMGRLAARRALTKEVRDLGNYLLERHQQAQDRLQQLARQLGIALSDRLSETHLRVQRRYAAISDALFDKAFVRHEVGDYRYFLARFEAAARSGSAPIRDYAAREIPQLEADQARVADLMRRQQ